MFTISGILVLSGFFVLYNTSQRAVLQAGPIVTSLLRANVLKAKILGLLLLMAGVVTLMTVKGFMAGILYFSILLMGGGSTVVMLHPLHLLKYYHLAILVIMCLSIELLF